MRGGGTVQVNTLWRSKKWRISRSMASEREVNEGGIKRDT